MKKIFCTVISIIIIISSITVVDFSAFALPDDIEIDSAVIMLKNAMIDRKDSVSVSFSNVLEQSEIEELQNIIFDYAISDEYSNSSVDGDYLRWSYIDMSAVSTITKLPILDKVIGFKTTYSISYYTTKAQEDMLTEELDKFIEDNELKSKGDYTKIKLIHDFVCRTTEYDWDTANETDYNGLSYTAYGAVLEHKAVCQGYAALFYRLCKEVGLDCRIITGENHVWNIVKLDGFYYEVDCTWDDTNEEDGYKYFLKGKNDFDGHTRIGDCASEAFRNCYPEADYGFGECTHKMGWKYPEDADCSAGFERSYVCLLCDYVGETQTIDADSEHEMIEEVFEPTCTQEGYTSRHCSVCSYREDKKDIKPTLSGTGEHVYDDGKITKEPTCIESGEMIYTCSFCENTKTQNIPKLGHTPGEQIIENICYPTCVTPGSYDVVVRCTACNEVLESVNVVKNVYDSHSYVQTLVKPPSCTAAGEVIEVCSICGVTRTQTIPIADHMIVEDNAVQASYTAAGLTSGSHCAVCGLVVTPQQSVPKLTVSKTALSSVKSSKKKELTVKWKKNTMVSGYEIQYTTDKKFKKSVKKAVIRKNKTASTTLKKLTGNKKYYVRIRSYKTVNGKTYYSSWSTVKSATVKKQLKGNLKTRLPF